MPNVSGMDMLMFAAATDDEDGARVASETLKLLQKIIAPTSWEAFVGITSDPDQGIGAEELGEIVAYLSEEYSDRPTSQS